MSWKYRTICQDNPKLKGWNFNHFTNIENSRELSKIHSLNFSTSEATEDFSLDLKMKAENLDKIGQHAMKLMQQYQQEFSGHLQNWVSEFINQVKLLFVENWALAPCCWILCELFLVIKNCFLSYSFSCPTRSLFTCHELTKKGLLLATTRHIFQNLHTLTQKVLKFLQISVRL